MGGGGGGEQRGVMAGWRCLCVKRHSYIARAYHMYPDVYRLLNSYGLGCMEWGAGCMARGWRVLGVRTSKYNTTHLGHTCDGLDLFPEGSQPLSVGARVVANSVCFVANSYSYIFVYCDGPRSSRHGDEQISFAINHRPPYTRSLIIKNRIGHDNSRFLPALFRPSP